MKISYKQLQILFEVFVDTISISERLAGISQKDRVKLWNEIVNQQSEELIEYSKK